MIAARSDAPLYLWQIEYGSSASKTQIPLLGSFQGIALPMLSGSNPYFGWADLSGAGYQAMAEQLRAYLKNFTRINRGWQSASSGWSTILKCSQL